jgi:hypothetical protein
MSTVNHSCQGFNQSFPLQSSHRYNMQSEDIATYAISVNITNKSTRRAIVHDAKAVWTGSKRMRLALNQAKSRDTGIGIISLLRKCVSLPMLRRIGSPDRIEGFEQLRDEDQKMVSKAFDEIPGRISEAVAKRKCRREEMEAATGQDVEPVKPKRRKVSALAQDEAEFKFPGRKSSFQQKGRTTKKRKLMQKGTVHVT